MKKKKMRAIQPAVRQFKHNDRISIANRSCGICWTTRDSINMTGNFIMPSLSFRFVLNRL